MPNQFEDEECEQGVLMKSVEIGCGKTKMEILALKRTLMKNEINVQHFNGVGYGNSFMSCNQKPTLHSTDDLSGETP